MRNYDTKDVVFRYKNNIYSTSVDCDMVDKIIISCHTDKSIRCFSIDKKKEILS